MRLDEFGSVSMRTDPPVDESYMRATYLLDLVDPRRTVVVNRPAGLRHANEKLYGLRFRRHMPETIVTASRADLVAFTHLHGTAVVKPTGAMGGRGIMLLRDGDPNLPSILDTVTERGRVQVMAQRFLTEVDAGDRRVIVLDGEPAGSVIRLASGLDFRCNMATGGTVKPDEIDDEVTAILDDIGPDLRRDGLWFVGLDIIGGRITEVNVTSPTGLREIHRLSGLDLADRYVEMTENLAKS
jgi:glutathione synthase